MEVWVLDNYAEGSMRAFKTEEQAFKVGLDMIIAENPINIESTPDEIRRSLNILGEYMADYESSSDSFGIDDWFLITPVMIEEE